VNTAHLIDPTAAHKFIKLIHERAAAAIAGMGDPRRPVLHLCSAAPDDTRFFHLAYNIGDIQHMAADALNDSEAGKNVFIEPRLVRPGLSHERGRLEATLAVFASVADGDVDTGKPFTAPVPASAIVQTSQTNEHSWYFLKRAIGAADAQELGKLMRQSAGGDHCSGNCVQPFRVAGCANYPDRKKAARGRIAVATSIKCITDKAYTADELRAHFSAAVPVLPTKQTPEPAVDCHSPAYSRAMAKAVLAAEPGADRSAAFMSAANHAVRGDLTADEFEALARQYPDGCAQKYIGDGRLKQEVARCYTKIVPGYATAYANEAQRRFMWHRNVIADSELGAGALRFAYLIAREPGNDRHVNISLQRAATELGIAKSTAQRGRDQLIKRRWLRLHAGAYALTRPYAGAYHCANENESENE
jgi:hypothetical protein